MHCNCSLRRPLHNDFWQFNFPVKFGNVAKRIAVENVGKLINKKMD